MIIQGCKDIFKSIYFRRCNGEYSNALGEPLVRGPAGAGLTLQDLSYREELERKSERMKENFVLIRSSFVVLLERRERVLMSNGFWNFGKAWWLTREATYEMGRGVQVGQLHA